jgi:hypothetical protein
LEFVDCTRVVPHELPFAPCTLAATLAGTRDLQYLGFTGTLLEERDMDLVCDSLTSEECAVQDLELGGTTKHSKIPCLSDASVRNFFKRLPEMKSLRRLTFDCSAPVELSRTVFAGLDRNYSLVLVQDLAFESNDAQAKAKLEREVRVYPEANARGRAAVARAAADPNSRVLRGAALQVINRLAASDDPDDYTSLVLCLHLFIPAFASSTAPGAEP